MPVGSPRGAEEVVLPQCHRREVLGGGAGLHSINSRQEFLTAKPMELATGKVVGEQLELVAGPVGLGNLACLLSRTFQKAALHAAALHTVRIVEIDTHDSAAGLYLRVAVADDWLAERQHEEEDGEDAGCQDEQLAQVALAAVLILQLLQHVHIAEIDLPIASQLQQVDGYRYADSYETYEKKRLG